MKNTVNLIGRIGNLKLVTYENGSLINISLALDDSYKDKDNKKVERTQWVNLTAHANLANYINENFKVGDQLAIIGKLIENKFSIDDKNISTVSVQILKIEFLACKNL